MFIFCTVWHFIFDSVIYWLITQEVGSVFMHVLHIHTDRCARHCVYTQIVACGVAYTHRSLRAALRIHTDRCVRRCVYTPIVACSVAYTHRSLRAVLRTYTDRCVQQMSTERLLTPSHPSSRRYYWRDIPRHGVTIDVTALVTALLLTW